MGSKILMIICTALLFVPTATGQTPPVFSDNDMFESIRQVEKGRDLLEKNKLKKARKRFEEALKLFDENFQAHANLALLDTIEKNHEAARQNFEMSLKKFSPYRDRMVGWKIRYARGTEGKASELNEAILANSEAEQRVQEQGTPDELTALELERASLEQQRDNLIRTIEDLWEEIELDRKMAYPAVYRARYGDLLFDCRDFEGAKQQYILAVETDPDIQDAWGNLAVCWFLQGKCKESRAAFLRAKAVGAPVNPNFEKDLKTLCGD